MKNKKKGQLIIIHVTTQTYFKHLRCMFVISSQSHFTILCYDDFHKLKREYLLIKYEGTVRFTLTKAARLGKSIRFILYAMKY